MQKKATPNTLKTSVRIAIDRMWRNNAERRLFEAECKFAPLAIEEAKLRIQQNDGTAQTYMTAFNAWAAAKIEKISLATAPPVV